MTAAALDPYEELAQLAAAAEELADEGRVEEIEPILDRSAELARGLPDHPPGAAAPALEFAAAAQERLRARLGQSLLATREEMELVGRGRRAARAYGGVTNSALDLRA